MGWRQNSSSFSPPFALEVQNLFLVITVSSEVVNYSAQDIFELVNSCTRQRSMSMRLDPGHSNRDSY